MKKNVPVGLLIALFAQTASAAPPAEIVIPGKRLWTESLTSTRDGSVSVATMGTGEIFRAKPGAATAELWIKPAKTGPVNLLGVYADDESGTLWACSFALETPEGKKAPRSTLRAFDLATG